MSDQLTQDPASLDATPVSTATPSTPSGPPKPPPAPKSKPFRPKKTRRAPGEGSVYERKSDGRWCATWTVTLPNGMTKKRVAYGDSKREAIESRAAAMKEAETQAENATKETVGLFMRRWLESIASTVRPTSYETYEQAIRLYIAPEKDRTQGRGIGGLVLAKLTPLDIQAWLSALEKRGVSASRRRELCRHLNCAFEYAVTCRLLKTNPMAGVTPPSVKREQMKV